MIIIATTVSTEYTLGMLHALLHLILARQKRLSPEYTKGKQGSEQLSYLSKNTELAING
jgi:hypothetical protein